MDILVLYELPGVVWGGEMMKPISFNYADYLELKAENTKLRELLALATELLLRRTQPNEH